MTAHDNISVGGDGVGSGGAADLHHIRQALSTCWAPRASSLASRHRFALRHQAGASASFSYAQLSRTHLQHVGVS